MSRAATRTGSQWSDWASYGLGWIRSQQVTILVIGFVCQLGVLLTMVILPLMTTFGGDTILLRTVPVDPRDLFRGDYVILNYEFNNIPPSLEESKNIERTVYVSLQPEADGKHWRAAHYSLEKPSSGKFLRGKTKGWNRIEFGIESFFVQQGEGLKYEQAVRSRTLSAEIALSRNGKAVLKQLVINQPVVTQAPVVQASPPDQPSLSLQELQQFAWQAELRLRKRQLSAREFSKSSQERGTIVLDTRSRESYQSFHIKGSINLPYDLLSSDTLREVIPVNGSKVLLISDNNLPGKQVPNNVSTGQNLGLKLPIFMQLDAYGYHNVWELATMIAPDDSEIDVEIPTKDVGIEP